MSYRLDALTPLLLLPVQERLQGNESGPHNEAARRTRFHFLKPCRSNDAVQECIPLERLVSPAYGISFGDHSFDSAIKHHNGTVEVGAQVNCSAAYVNVMYQFQLASNGSTLSNPWGAWNRFRHPPPSHQEAISNPYARLWDWLVSPFRSIPSPEPSPLPQLTDEARIIYQELLRLQSLNSDSQNPPMYYASVSLPPFPIDDQTTHLLLSAGHADVSVLDIAHSPAAAAHGLPLCLVSSEWWPCRTLGVLVLEVAHEGNAVDAALWRNGQGSKLWADHHATLDLPAGSNITSWINAFAQDQYITSAFAFLSRRTDHVDLIRAIRASDIGDRLYEEDEEGMPAECYVALGMAALARESSESQQMDCIEDKTCWNIRRQADRMVGKAPEGGMWSPPREREEHAEL